MSERNRTTNADNPRNRPRSLWPATPAPHRPGVRRIKNRARWIRPPWGTPYRREIIEASIALRQAYQRGSDRVPELEARFVAWCKAAGYPVEWEDHTCPTCGGGRHG
jgi:hypothetical protein